MNRVPKSDAAVSSATTRDQQSFLVRRPGERLDRGLVAKEFPHGVRARLRVRRPDQELVIIASRGQLHVIVAPLQPTNFLSVAKELSDAI
eukprot:CAMPEP_0185573784 /NCGR_PEP_ID=MMETSP0434-20130131/5399_1 /TAXON_ID=626734 ORGANISM="Favella taraikaensis, Strain Fe Narragansett Bay" /NCGR_SAMPLE_ID=MMETSP0434 /ASSEMBLY_ACC=CAM_ASM_000379 /LENGTH=89 /DNA_ID=CAMNT_0028190117 /DNA_START=522 /DNA_END=791 /DNA_ORIENTATION=+